MRSLIGVCVRRPVVVTVSTLFALLLGVWSALRAPLDVFPEFVPSQVDIQTEAPGFAPQQVEELVTRPVENAVNGSSGVATLRSESVPGLSVVTITFRDGVDVPVVRQGIAERLAELAGSLPAGVGTPKLSPLVSSTMDLLKIGLVSRNVDPYTLRDTAEWVIKPRLLAVPGVAHVNVFGGAVRQIHILPDIEKLSSFGVSFADVADAAKAALPLRGAGFVDTAAQRILLQSPLPGPDIDALGQAVVTVRHDTPVLVRDVAAVKMAPALRFGDSLIMGQPGVLLALTSQFGANTLDTTRTVETVLAELDPALERQGIILYRNLHRPANFIERALQNLEDSLLTAALLILLVLYLFLRDWRACLIAFSAIPLSLLAAVSMLRECGQTLNTMTLGGFAVGMGILVDDAIIGIENILRRLQENLASAARRSRLQVILDASCEVRGPVIHATIVVIAVFLPEIFTSSIQGRFVGPLALAFVFAVLSSLVVAMTTTPSLCALLLRGQHTRSEVRWLARLKSWQARVMCRVGDHLTATLAILSLLVTAALAALPFLGGTFMPDFREGHFVMQVSSSIPGTSLEEMLDLGSRISRDVLALPYVQSVEQQIGRAEQGEDTWGPHQSEFHVELKSDSRIEQSKAQKDLRRILAPYPGIQSEVVTFLGDRISESLSGVNAQVAIEIFGQDLDILDATGGKIAAALAPVEGIADLQFKHQGGTPTLALRVNFPALAAAGLRLQDVLDSVQAAYAGVTLGQTFDGARTIDVRLLLPDEARHQPTMPRHLMIAGPMGPVPLSQLVTVDVRDDRYSIEHAGGQRLVLVTFNARSGSLQSVVNDARRAIAAAVALPTGVFLKITGAAEAELETRHELLLYSGIALAAILVILFMSFRWRSNSWLVLINLPFSVIGSVLVIAVGGLGLSLGAVVGLVTVFGISARNSLLQLAHYEHLVMIEQQPWNLELIIRGANERLVPILMTAAVTALGLAPLAWGLHEPGQEIEGPMAVTVLGGLVSSTLLNVLVLPVLAHRIVRAPGGDAAD